MKFDDMHFFEILNGACPLCGKELVVADNDYWGCPETHFFVEFDKVGKRYLYRLSLYLENPEASVSTYSVTIYPQNHVAYIVPKNKELIRMPLVNKQILLSFLNKNAFKKCETMMLLK